MLCERLHPVRHANGYFRRRAFTVVELLVVLSLMAILITLTWPVMRSMTASNRIEGAVNSVSAAATVMRALNSQSRPDVDHLYAHNGTALVVLPRSNYNEMRWTTNTGVAKVGSHFKNIYNDIDSEREPARMPAGMGIVGIVKPGDDQLVNPPFAVRFNRFGQVVPVHLDSPLTPQMIQNLVRYQNNVDLHCVVGVVVFDQAKAKAADLNVVTGGQPTNAIKPATKIEDLVKKASGRVIFFSRYTGAAVMQGVAP